MKRQRKYTEEDMWFMIWFGMTIGISIMGIGALIIISL